MSITVKQLRDKLDELFSRGLGNVKVNVRNHAGDFDYLEDTGVDVIEGELWLGNNIGVSE